MWPCATRARSDYECDAPGFGLRSYGSPRTPVTRPGRIYGRSRGRIRHDVIRRIVPNLSVRDGSAGHGFYVDFLGLAKEFDLGWITSFRSPENPSIRVSLVSGGCFRAGGLGDQRER